MDKLNEILGKQNQSLALVQAANQALNNLQSLAQKQLAATQALEQAVNNQITAIKTATFSGLINLPTVRVFVRVRMCVCVCAVAMLDAWLS